MADAATAAARALDRRRPTRRRRRRRAIRTGQALLPFIGPLRALHRLGPGGARSASSSRSCCRRRGDTLDALVTGLAGGPLLADFARHGEAHAARPSLIAAVVGVPLGVLLGSNEKAYRSVEFLIDFFRSTPSSALIPLFLLIFGVSDINKVAIAAFGALADRASSTAPTA